MNDNYDDDQEPSDDRYDDQPRANQLVRRSFEGVATLANNAATQALTAKATADINARWMIAMHRPRHLMDVRESVLHECRRPKFAKAAIYAVPRAGTTIKGLSIRFAEAAMKAMGNMGCEAQTLYDSDLERVVRVTVTDFESNSMWSRDLTIRKTKEVKKNPGRHLGERINSYGETNFIVNATDDDVTTKEAAAISKASRTGILRLIPAWLLSEAQEMCERIQKDAAAADPDAERRKVFDAFSGLNVRPSWVADWLGHPVEQATPAEIVDLQQLYRAIREGQLTPDEAMRARKGDKPDPVAGGVASAMAPPKSERKPRGASASAARAGDPPPISPEEAAEIARLEAQKAKG